MEVAQSPKPSVATSSSNADALSEKEAAEAKPEGVEPYTQQNKAATGSPSSEVINTPTSPAAADPASSEDRESAKNDADKSEVRDELNTIPPSQPSASTPTTQTQAPLEEQLALGKGKSNFRETDTTSETSQPSRRAAPESPKEVAKQEAKPAKPNNKDEKKVGAAGGTGSGVSAPATAPTPASKATDDGKVASTGEVTGTKSRAADLDAKDSPTGKKLQATSNLKAKKPAFMDSTTEKLTIKTVQFTIQTTNLDDAINRTELLTRTQNGNIASKEIVTKPEGRTAQITIKVLANNFKPLVAELPKVGKVIQQSDETWDVTARYLQLTTEIANTQKQEAESSNARSDKPSSTENGRAREVANRQLTNLSNELNELKEGIKFTTIKLNLKDVKPNSKE
jgi:hypothetical protein